MQTRDIDLRLQRYTAAEHRIGSNLQELEQHSVYQLMTTDVLAGKTAQALGKARDADPSLWDMFMLLSATLDRARTLRGTGSRLRNESRLELAKLFGPEALVLTSTDVPLADRGLTGAASNEERLSIDELIDRMRSLYEPLRDTITHAEEVLRDVLPRLDSAERTLTHLRSECIALRIDSVDLDRIANTISRVRDLSLTDPLAIPKNSRDVLDESLASAARRIADSRTSHDELAADIVRAEAVLDECRRLILDADRARAETARKIARPVGLRRPPSMDAIDGPRGLASRLEPILSASGPWQSVRAALDPWQRQAKRLHDQLVRVDQANRDPLRRRDELRGRLQAFRAKMAATGHSEDLVLADLSAEAHNELFTSPTDLARAERLVSEFGSRLATSR